VTSDAVKTDTIDRSADGCLLSTIHWRLFTVHFFSQEHNEMTLKRFVIEMGMGVDQHGQEPTVAAARAVRNAITHNALPGIWEVAGLSDPNDMIVEVQVAVPYPDQVRQEEVLAVLPFGRKSLQVQPGGMVVQGRAIASLNDKNDEMLIAVASVTVYIEVADKIAADK
jgi:uncharacterized protein (TIGR02058 family)